MAKEAKPSSEEASTKESDKLKPIVLKESDFNAKKEEEKERQLYGDGLSISDIVTFAEKMRPRLRLGKHIDIPRKFKRYSSVMRKVGKNYIRVLNLEGASFSGDDMSRISFALSNLEGVNFSGANLENTVFAYANLENANFAGANLKGVDFSNANLLAADFTGARLSNTNFYKATVNSIKTQTPRELEIIEESVKFYRVQR